MRGISARLSAALGLLLAAAGTALAQTPRLYEAHFTDAPPVIDGTQTTPDEWSSAAAGGDQWLGLTARSVDATNNRFEVLWDDNGLYVRHQVDWSAWQNRATSVWDPGYENLNLFLDPNTDGEPNENTELFGTSIDGYQLGINQPLGESEINPNTQSAGVFSEAHVNALFGNNGGPFSGFSGLLMKQTTSVEQKTGYTELYIPWNNFDATDPADGFNPEIDDIGLYHPQAPSADDQWYFNVTRVQTNGGLPSWESPAGAFFMAERPHGILKFGPRSGSIPCDLTGDFICNAQDIDNLSGALLTGSSDLRYDFDGSGTFDADDRTYYIEVELFTWIGDSNLDGEFGTADLVEVFAVGGYEDGIDGNTGWAGGDWSGDMDFTTIDFVAAFASGGYEQGQRPQPVGAVSAVPEPATLGLALTGLIGLICCRRQGCGTSRG